MALILSGTNGISSNASNWAIQPDESGRVRMPNQISFMAFSDINNNVTYSAGQTIVLNQTRFNIGNAFNTSTGRFTAPVSGSYLMCLNLYTNDNEYKRYRLLRNNSEAFCGQGGTGGGGISVDLAGVVYLNAGDFVNITPAYNTSVVFQEGNHTTFSGFLIG